MRFWDTELGKKFSHTIHEHNSAIGMIRSYVQFIETYYKDPTKLTEERFLLYLKNTEESCKKALDAVDYTYKYAQEQHKKEQESKLKTIHMKVVSYCDIPEDLTQDSWLSESGPNCFVDYKVSSDPKYTRTDLDNWIIETYPELLDVDFLIEIDY